jgi:hypothetical protein
MSHKKSFVLPILAGLALLAVVHLLLVIGGTVPVLEAGVARSMTDSDGYTRLLRVQELWTHGQWFDPVLRSLSPPDGIVMHWGRAIDLLLLPSVFVGAMFDRVDSALFWSGLLFAPFFHLLMVPVLVAGGRRVMPTLALWLLPVLLVFQRTMLMDSIAGRPDHHVLLGWVFAFCLALLLRRTGQPEGTDDRRTMVWIGLIAGFALWATPEALLIVLAVVVILGWHWIAGDERALECLWTAAVALALATSAAFVAERPSSDWLSIELDRLSIAHLTAVWILAAATHGTRMIRQRRPHLLLGRRAKLLLSLGAAFVGSCLLVALFPEILRGGYARIAPEVRALLVSVVPAELPLLPNSPKGAFDFLVDLGLPLVAAAYVIYGLRREYAPRFVVYAASLAIFLPLAVYIARFAMYAELAALYPAAELLARLLRRAALALRQRRWGVLCGALAGTAAAASPFALAGVIKMQYFPDAGFRLTRSCAYSDLYDHLEEREGWQSLSGTILTDLFDGPEVAYKFGRPAVTGPYHRDTAGISDWDRMVTGNVNDPTLHALLSKRNVGIILFCGKNLRKWRPLFINAPDSLISRAALGRPAPWMEHVPLPPQLARQYVVYKVAGVH